MPLFFFDINVASPSIRGPARAVAIKLATKDETLHAPTAVMEKLYGGADMICDKVIEMRTSQEMQVVKSSAAQATIGEAKKKKGRMSVRQKEI